MSDGDLLHRGATVMGCYGILFAAFQRIGMGLRVEEWECCLHQKPLYHRGAAGLSKRLKEICKFVASCVKAKSEYVKVCHTTNAGSEAFSELKGLEIKLLELEKILRDASALGEPESRAAIRSATNKIKKMRQLATAQESQLTRLLNTTVNGFAVPNSVSGEAVRTIKPAKVETKTSLPTRSVVSLDMVHYGQVSTQAVDTSFDKPAKTVMRLNDEIRILLRKALKQANVSDSNVHSISTGDGGLLFFVKADDAVNFAFKFNKNVDQINSHEGRGKSGHKFRIGIATGEVCLRRYTDSKTKLLLKFDIAGLCIARAVRIEARCCPGEIYICSTTYRAMDNSFHPSFESEGEVTGKDHETWPIKVHHTDRRKH